MAKTFEDSTGKQFSTQAEAAASNTAMGTNPITKKTVPSDLLQGSPKLTIKPTAPSTGATGMSSAIETNVLANQDQYTRNLDEQAKLREQDMKSSSKDYISTLLGQKGEAEQTADAYSKTVDPLQGELTDINNQINAEIQANRRRVQALQKNPTGMLAGALQNEVTRIENESLAKQADLSVIQMAIQGKYDSAKAIADRAIQVRLEQQKSELEARKTIYEENKALWTRDEQRAFDTAQKDRERKIAKEEAEMQKISDLSIEAAKNGAPASVISAISSAKNFEEALVAGIKYMSDPLDRSYKAAQIRKLQLENNSNDPTAQQAILNSVVNEKDPTKLISNFFKSNPKIESNQDINNAAAVVSSINEISTRVTGGKIKGYGLFGGGFMPEAFKSQEGITNKAQISAVEGKLQQWLSGAALSKAQEKLVNKMIPERNDTDATVRTKLNNLTNYMLGDIKGRATAQGAQFEYIPVNLFTNTPTESDVKTATVQAVASGYKPSEVIDYVSSNYPEKAAQIKQARDNGYSDDEIIQYLSL